MDNEHFFVDYVSDRQVAEKLRKQIVDLEVVLMFALSFKSVHFVKLFSLVVSAAHEKVLGQAHFPS